MKCFTLASFWLLSVNGLMQISPVTPATFVVSNFASSTSSQSLLSPNNKASPSTSPCPTPLRTTPSIQPQTPGSSSFSPQLTGLRYSNEQSSDMFSISTMPIIVEAEKRRQEWMERSVNYYAKVMREERRRGLGQAKAYETQKYQENFNILAMKHYFALKKIKTGKAHHAECIYRRIIDKLQHDTDCDHAKLAVTTLLLTLLLQRVGTAKQTRSVFLNFFRVVMMGQKDDDREKVFDINNPVLLEQCACSAKVMQAYALFEMKQGNTCKSLQLVKTAIQLDPTLASILKWQKFRDAAERKTRNV